MGNYSVQYVKQRTAELYDSLPMDLEQRKKCIAVRDEIIELNYPFFGYVANSTFVENTQYEDKFQTAILSFLGMWWKYKWTPKYRDDLSFAVFFKPRISEEIRRMLSTISYSSKRSLCSKVAKQLGKHWSDVSYEDLSKVQLSTDDMVAIKVILGAAIPEDLSQVDNYLEAPAHTKSIEDYMTDEFDSIEELLIQEMITQESKLTDKNLLYLSELYGIPFIELKAKLPDALETLHKRLTDNL